VNFLKIIAFVIWGCVVIVGCQKNSLSQNPESQPPQGWVSSGGEILSDDSNPWFLETVSEVRYCISVDEPTVSRSRIEIRKIIQTAISYWTGEFSNFYKGATVNGFELPRVAQKYREVDCTGEEDLCLQFGEGTLSDAQRRYLRSQNEYLSLAVRTAYDKVHLRGKGFIYIASDKGQSPQPQGPLFVEAPWRYEGLLFRVVSHELGHVFGLPHLGQGLMSAQFPEHILKKSVYQKYEKMDPDHFFMPQESYLDCQISEASNPEAFEWFKIPKDHKCLKITGVSDGSGWDPGYYFASSESATGPTHELGKAVVRKVDVPQIELTLAGFLYLPDEELVFVEPEYKKLRQIPTSAFLDVNWSLNFSGGVEPSRPIQMRMKPTGYDLLAVINGKIFPLLTYRRACLSVASFLVCTEP
jgi:translation elongation factor P/translation initiation factor 5A